MDATCRPAVNAIECSGCGGCVDMHPHMFGWDDTAERPVVKDGRFPCEDVRQAVAICPRDCIEAVDEE